MKQKRKRKKREEKKVNCFNCEMVDGVVLFIRRKTNDSSVIDNSRSVTSAFFDTNWYIFFLANSAKV